MTPVNQSALYSSDCSVDGSLRSILFLGGGAGGGGGGGGGPPIFAEFCRIRWLPPVGVDTRWKTKQSLLCQFGAELYIAIFHRELHSRIFRLDSKDSLAEGRSLSNSRRFSPSWKGCASGSTVLTALWQVSRNAARLSAEMVPMNDARFLKIWLDELDPGSVAFTAPNPAPPTLRPAENNFTRDRHRSVLCCPLGRNFRRCQCRLAPLDRHSDFAPRGRRQPRRSAVKFAGPA